MKYSIFINQKAVATHFKDANLDLIDMAVFDYCRDIIASPNVKLERVLFAGKLHTWINYAHLARSMPLLGITANDVVRRRINTLVDAKLLIRYVRRSKTYFTLGEKADLLNFESELISDTPPEKPSQTHIDAQEAPVDSPGVDTCTPDECIKNSAVSEQTKPNPKVGLTPNSEVQPHSSDGVAQPNSGALSLCSDGLSPTEQRDYYNIKIIQSDQNIRIKGDKDAVPAAAYADGLTPLSPKELAFYKLWEQTHCCIVRHFHKERIRLVLEKYSPSETVIEMAIKKNKREDWACEDIVLECNRIPQPRSTAKRLREYVESIRRKQRAAGIVC